MDVPPFILIELDWPHRSAPAFPGAPIEGRGWAIGNRRIASIALYLGAHRLGFASYGLPRPDIGGRYPHYAGSEASGFTFAVTLPAEARDGLLRAVATAEDGTSAETCIALAWPDPKAALLRLTVEHCDLADGILEVSGWTRSVQAPVVTLWLDDAELPAPVLSPPPQGALDGATLRPFRLACAVTAEAGTVRVVARADGAERQVALPLRAPPPPPLVFPAGAARIGVDGMVHTVLALEVSGWALGPAPIETIWLEAGAVRARAETGLPRPDLGTLYPRLPHARHAGFHIRLTQPPPGPARLIVQDPDGTPISLSLPAPQSAWAETPRLMLDGLERGVLALPPGERLLTGYAAAPNEISQVSLDRGGVCLASAKPTLRRPDAAGSYPFWPTTLTCGFALMLPSSLPPGDHALTLRADPASAPETVPGTELSFLLRVPPPAPEPHPRRRVPQAETALRRSLLATLGTPPSVMVVLRDGPGRARTLDSLIAQTFPEWRVLLLGADAPPPLPDPRMACVPAGGASDADFGGADYAMLLHAGDTLAADAVLSLVLTARLTGADFVYADDWRQDPTTGAAALFRKPALTPALFCTLDVPGRAWCATTRALRAAGVTPAGFATSGAYACARRVFAAGGRAEHLPEILLEAAGAMDMDADRSARAGERLPGPGPATGHIQRAAAEATISVIIPTAGARGLIGPAIRSVRASAGRTIEIVVVAHHGPALDPLLPFLADAADRIVAFEGRFNWSAACNLGAAAASGTVLLFLNDDIEATEPGWLDALLDHALTPDVGAAGAQLVYPDGHIQHAGMMLRGPHGVHLFRHAPADWPGPFGLARVAREVTAVTGACLMTRRDVFERVGRFNEAHDIINNDLDYCLRAGQMGLRVVYTPHARLVHHELASRAALPDRFDAEVFTAAWRLRLLRGDPIESPALDRSGVFRAPDPEPLEWLHLGLLPYDPAALRTVLVCVLGDTGDFTSALPALAHMRAALPRVRLVLLTADANAALAALAPVDAVETVAIPPAPPGRAAHPLGPQDAATLTARLSRERFDLAIDLGLSSDHRELLRLTGATWCAGYDCDGLFPWLDVALTTEGSPPLWLKRTPAAAALLRLAAAATALPPQQSPAADWQAPAVGVAYVCLAPGARGVLERWPAASFAGLMALLLADYDLSVVVLAGAADGALATEVAYLAGCPDRVTVRTLPDGPGGAAALLRGAALHVGNDSDLTHLAAVLGVPTVGIHAANQDATARGSAGPRTIMLRRRMTCGPCYLADPGDCPRGVTCLRDITPAEVYRACRLLLGFTFGSGSAASAAAGAAS